jgi:hypothetical protein
MREDVGLMRFAIYQSVAGVSETNAASHYRADSRLFPKVDKPIAGLFLR